MERNFTEHFNIIYEKFIVKHATLSGGRALMGLARFLGHGHDGKVRAWKKGQWPSAEDCWVISEKMGFSLRWLVTGEGKSYGRNDADSAGTGNVAAEDALQALQSRMQAMEQELAEERSLNRKLTARLLVDGVGDKGVAPDTGKAGQGHGG